MRKLSAHYILVKGEKALKMGYIQLDANQVIIDIRVWDREVHSTEFFNGILSPSIINIGEDCYLNSECPFGFELGGKYSIFQLDKIDWENSRIDKNCNIKKII